jgi:hypothetical protein
MQCSFLNIVVRPETTHQWQPALTIMTWTQERPTCHHWCQTMGSFMVCGTCLFQELRLFRESAVQRKWIKWC